MPIINLIVGETAQVGEFPRTNKMITSDNLATITEAGYLNNSNTSSKQIAPTDIFDVIYSYVPTSSFASASGFGHGTYGRFTTSFSNGVITLVPWSNAGEVSLIGTAVAGNIAIFANSSGDIEDLGIAPSTDAYSYFSAVDGSVNIGNVPSFIDVNGSLQDSGVVAQAVLQSSLASVPDANANLIVSPFDIAAASLATGGSVTLLTPTGSKSYQILNARIVGTTNFSGGGGDRNVQLKIGSGAYSIIPAATVQALANTSYQIGSTEFPYSALGTTPIIAANPLSISYQGGATDYTTGSITIQITFLRTA